MKRILMLIIIVMLSASTAFASIPKDEVSVAGLYVGETTEMVTKLFGKPEHMTAGKTGPVWHYNRLSVYTADSIVVRVISASPKHPSTPSGINVGASLETIIETYGDADEIIQEQDERYMEYRYYDEDGLCLQFTIFKETGKAVNIQIRRHSV